MANRDAATSNITIPGRPLELFPSELEIGFQPTFTQPPLIPRVLQLVNYSQGKLPETGSGRDSLTANKHNSQAPACHLKLMAITTV